MTTRSIANASLLCLALLLSGCNLFLDLVPLPNDDQELDAGMTSDGDIQADAKSDSGIAATGLWSFVATGTYHSCGIRQTGETYCWGRGERYQLGNGSDASSATPVLVQTVDFELKSLALSEDFSCGLDTSDELWCWGSFVNFGGPEYQTPTQIKGGKWKKVDASQTHACALSMDDELWCWGHNHSEQILAFDVERIEDLGVPTQVVSPNPRPILDIAVGARFTCVLFEDVVECGGRPVDAIPGAGATSEFVKIELDFETNRIEAGESHVCLLGQDGQARCLGGADYLPLYRVPAGTKEFSEFLSAPNLQDLSLGDRFGCAIDTDQHLVCWGLGNRGRLGRGEPANDYETLGPGPTLSRDTYTQVSSRFQHACALTTDGNIDCWGLGTYGRIGDGDLGFSTAPLPISADRRFVEVELAHYHTCGLQADGVVACWGRGSYLGLGNGSLEHQRDPVNVPGVDARFLAVGGYQSCVVNKDNTVACWGQNVEGLLGNGMRGDALLPETQEVVQSDPIAGITMGRHNACYWLDLPDNTTKNAYCWGRDRTLGTPGDGIEPTFLVNHLSRANIRAGYDHVCATNFDTIGVCWGLNEQGQLGDGTTDDNGVGIAIVGGTPSDFRVIQAGEFFSCGIDSSDKLWCWGQGGRLGDGTYTQQLLPKPSLLQENIKDLGGQGGSMCAITMDDKLYCWGNNSLGSAGVGSLEPVVVPTLVNLPEAIIDVDGEESSMCAVGESGRVYCWGEQTFYRAGNHVFGMKTEPTRIVVPN